MAIVIKHCVDDRTKRRNYEKNASVVCSVQASLLWYVPNRIVRIYHIFMANTNITDFAKLTIMKSKRNDFISPKVASVRRRATPRCGFIHFHKNIVRCRDIIAVYSLFIDVHIDACL